MEAKIFAIHDEHKDFGYRRMQAILQKEGINVNKKKVQRIMQKLGWMSPVEYRLSALAA